MIHLHAIVDAICLLGRDFEPTQEELARARKTKADRFFGFNAAPDTAIYDAKFNAPMLWNSNLFMTLESMKILRVLTDVWLPDFKFGPGHCAMALAKTPWYWDTVTRNLALLEEWGEDFSIREWLFSTIGRADVADFLVRQIDNRASVGATPVLIN